MKKVKIKNNYSYKSNKHTTRKNEPKTHSYKTLKLISTLYRPELFYLNCTSLRNKYSTSHTQTLSAKIGNQTIKLIRITN